jgi:hypothetical protein
VTVRNVAKFKMPAIRRASNRDVLKEIEAVAGNLNELDSVRSIKRDLLEISTACPDIDMAAIVSDELTRIGVGCYRTKIVTHKRTLTALADRVTFRNTRAGSRRLTRGAWREDQGAMICPRDRSQIKTTTQTKPMTSNIHRTPRVGTPLKYP